MSNDANWYGEVFKGWSKALGPKPTADMLASIHKLGARPGKQALAIAMGLRDTGVTGAQIVMACGAPQLNKMRGFITDSLLKREAVSPAANNHTVYKLVITPKGLQRIKRTEANEAKAVEAGKGEAVAKPTKAKGAPKRKAAKVTAPADTATSAADTGSNEPASHDGENHVQA